MKYTVVQYVTPAGKVPYKEWLEGLKDNVAKIAILRRVNMLELGHFGDCEPVGDGVSELRLHLGPGYRVYFAIHGKKLCLMLGGGTKRSQRRDINRAKQHWQDYQDQ